MAANSLTLASDRHARIDSLHNVFIQYRTTFKSKVADKDPVVIPVSVRYTEATNEKTGGSDNSSFKYKVTI